MTDKHDNGGFEGWTGDLWDMPEQAWDRESGGQAGRDALDCRNYGAAALASAVLAFPVLSLGGAVLAFVLASVSRRRGCRAREAGCDGPPVRLGMGLSTAARIVAAVYLVLLVFAVIFTAFVIGGIFLYADRIG